jgi:hypothetical protein
VAAAARVKDQVDEEEKEEEEEERPPALVQPSTTDNREGLCVVIKTA